MDIVHTHTFTPRKGDAKRLGRLIMLQHQLSTLSARGSRSKRVNMIRDIILGIHYMSESCMDYLMGRYYLSALRGKKFKSLCEDLLVKISFYDKVLILKKIGLIEKQNFKMLEKINDIRNGFVHGYSIRDKKFLYKGKKITLWGHVEVLVKDFELFLSKIEGEKVNLLPEDE